MANERELIEQATAAHRAQNPDGSLRVHPAWLDLPPEAREEVFEETLKLRQMEAALHPIGMSTTVRSVLERIRRGG